MYFRVCNKLYACYFKRGCGKSSTYLGNIATHRSRVGENNRFKDVFVRITFVRPSYLVNVLKIVFFPNTSIQYRSKCFHKYNNVNNSKRYTQLKNIDFIVSYLLVRVDNITGHFFHS